MGDLRPWPDEVEDAFQLAFGDPIEEPCDCIPSYMIVRFVTKRFVAGVIINEDGIVIEAAPTLRWGMGKYFMVIHDWLKRKGQLEYFNAWEIKWR